ncbi:MAG: hypothetical protein IJM26_10095, partial [Lachnospiraceae bacterium]|nr:hypothetical protein [Lachnospiraceae bacterium]
MVFLLIFEATVLKNTFVWGRLGLAVFEVEGVFVYLHEKNAGTWVLAFSVVWAFFIRRLLL